MRAGETVVGRFRLDALAGAGGMGSVYRATDLGSGAPVAVKCLLAAAGDAARFAREAAVLAEIAHPRVVRYLDHGATDGGEPYLVMDWLEGEPLDRRLGAGALSLVDALLVVEGVAAALAALHERGVVHRDVKPANLFLVGGEPANVKLLDLGIARHLQVAWSLTATGAAIGTPAYMSPEQARGRHVGPASDVFALGCVLFECVAGRPPFLADHPIAVLAKMLIEDAPRLAEVVASVPASLDALVAAMLAKDPAARPADGAAVGRALASLDLARAAEPRPQLGLGSSEQRVVSVVLSRPAHATDETVAAPERGGLVEQVQAAAAAFGAEVDALSNGSFVILVRGHEAPTDQATRAARCAFAVSNLLGADAIALATGRAIVAGRAVVGPVLERAVSLLSASGGGVRVDAATADLLDGRFEIAGEGQRRELVGERDAFAPARRLLGRVTPCVGRERELGMLRAALATAIEEPVATAVVVTAPAGTGKSRLVAELTQAARGHAGVATVLVGRCDPMSAGSPFGVLADALRRAARADGEPGAPLEELIRRRVAPILAPADAERIGELLGEIAGCPAAEATASERLRALRRDRILLGDAIAAAWVDWLAAECDRGAVVLVLEDLHWGDAPSFGLVDRALRVLVDRPLLVVATARPAIDELAPKLWADRGVQEVKLGAVSSKAAERLVRALLPDVAAPTLAWLVERAAGHPFMLEELIRTVADGAQAGSLPESVLGLVQARFDALGDEARALLRAASVFGERFWIGGATALLGGAIGLARADSLLDDLARRDFVVRTPSSSLHGEDEYGFRHAIVRDAAYATTTDADRQLGHRLAASWLERAGFADPLSLAEHFDRGGEGARAAPYFERAAVQAFEGGDLVAAVERAEKAIVRAEEPASRARAELVLADARYWRGEIAEARRLAESAAGSLERGTERWFAAVSMAITAAGQAGNEDVVSGWLDQAIAASSSPGTDAQIICISRAASQLGYAGKGGPALARVEALATGASPGPLAVGWINRARAEAALMNEPDFGRRYIAGLAAAGRAFEDAGAPRYASLMLAFVGFARAYSGDRPGAFEAIDTAIGQADRLGSPFLRGFTRLELALARMLFGEHEEAVAAAEASTPFVRGNKRLETLLDAVRGAAAIDRGALDEAERRAQALLALDHPVGRKPAHAMMARVALERGELDLARARSAEAWSTRLDEPFALLGGIAALIEVEGYENAGELDEARRLVALALDTMKTDPLCAADRASFFRRPFPNARLLAMADRLGVPRPD